MIATYMGIGRKIASAGLATLLATAAVVRVMTCPGGLLTMGGSHHPMAMTGMAMPGVHSPQLRISEQRTELCCRVSPAELPKQIPPIFWDDITAAALASNLGIQAQNSNRRASFLFTSHIIGSPPRELLCVFLI